MKIIKLVFTGFAVFLILDSALAIFLGKRYMLWGLEYMPYAYQKLIERLSKTPSAVLLGIKLAESAIGITLYAIIRKLK